MPPERNVLLVLFSHPDDEARIGPLSNVLFHCHDIRATHAELVSRGVEFPEEPRREFWGWWAVFRDSEGNSFGLGQRGE